MTRPSLPTIAAAYNRCADKGDQQTADLIAWYAEASAPTAWGPQDWPLFDQLLAAQHSAVAIDAVCKAATDAIELEAALEAVAFNQRIGRF